MTTDNPTPTDDTPPTTAADDMREALTDRWPGFTAVSYIHDNGVITITVDDVAAHVAAVVAEKTVEVERLTEAPSTQPYDVVQAFPETARDRYMFEAGRIHQCREQEGCCEGCQTHHGCRCGDENGGY